MVDLISCTDEPAWERGPAFFFGSFFFVLQKHVSESEGGRDPDPCRSLVHHLLSSSSLGGGGFRKLHLRRILPLIFSNSVFLVNLMVYLAMDETTV